MIKLPPIIFTDPPSRNYPHIFVYARDFFPLLQQLEIKYVYSAYGSPHLRNTDLVLYFTNGGFIIAMSSYEREYLKEIIPKDFEDFYVFMEANFLGIKTMEEFNTYKTSEFYTAERNGYQEYLRAKTLGFTAKNEYQEAKSYGITDYEHYREYKASDMGYRDFIKAKEGGFTTKRDLYEAKTLGLSTFNELIEYKKHRFDPYLEKTEEIRKDALEAFNIQRYEEFLRLEYLLAEKLIETLYFKTFGKELDQKNEEHVLEILNSIEKKLNQNYNVKELDEWRRERNLVIHEHKKVSSESAQKARMFFEHFYNDIIKEFK